MSLSILNVLFDCLVHPLLSVKLDCFLLPLEKHSEWGVEEADSGLKPGWDSIAEKFDELDIIVSTLCLILSEVVDVDEPPHQIHSYTLLFSLFLHFPYIADPPLHTSAST